MLFSLIAFIQKFGYVVIADHKTAFNDIQNNKADFSRAFRVLKDIYNLDILAVTDFLYVWQVKVEHSSGYLLNEIIDTMCYKTDDFIKELKEYL